MSSPRSHSHDASSVSPTDDVGAHISAPIGASHTSKSDKALSWGAITDHGDHLLDFRNLPSPPSRKSNN